MLLDYLTKNYKPNEPIFLSDINLPSISNNNLRQMFKSLCDSEQIKRYDSGIYYIPASSRIKGGIPIPPGIIAQYKYIIRNGNIEGYYSGFTFANQLGISTQVPYTLEIVSNNSGGKYREVKIKEQRIILRKPKTLVNNDNYQTLQLLDLLKDLDEYADGDPRSLKSQIIDYIQMKKITKPQIDCYIALYPDKIYRTFYELELYDVLTP